MSSIIASWSFKRWLSLLWKCHTKMLIDRVLKHEAALLRRTRESRAYNAWSLMLRAWQICTVIKRFSIEVIVRRSRRISENSINKSQALRISTKSKDELLLYMMLFVFNRSLLSSRSRLNFRHFSRRSSFSFSLWIEIWQSDDGWFIYRMSRDLRIAV